MAVNEHDDKAGSVEADGRIAALYRDASREEPPARLDRVITRAAREPAGTPAEPQRVPWWIAWRMPFAVAALAVVSVSLVTLMVEEDADRVVRVPSSAPSMSEPVLATEDAPAVPALPRAPEFKPERADEPAAAPRTNMRARDDRSAPDAAVTRAPVVQGPVPAEAPAAADASSRVLEKASSADAAPSAKYEAAKELARDAASAPQRRLEGQAAAIEDRTGAAPQAERRSATPAPKPPASPGALSVPVPAAKSQPAPAPPATIGLRGLESEAASQRARPSPEVARHVLELDREAPAVWIERVVALRKEGRFSEADGVLAEFRQRFPSVQLPPGLP